ncbi:MAG: NAD-binding protein [Rhodobacteraceae bacterium]|uniref:potassium channel family protein n=1 Tax=Marivita sp. TaxID=2003365 RepID=UPI003B52C313|nr:NAD-binding protein [Paracoccaceae bacterium]
MRIVIVGASRFGVATAERLIEAGHEVVLIDHDGDRLSALSEELDAGLLEGDGSLPSVLRNAYGDGADALVALTNVDDVNILAALVGQSVGFERVVPQIVRRELLAVCDALGLENLITPHATVARSIVHTLETRHDASLDLRSHQGFDVLGYPMSEDHEGMTVNDLDLPKATRVIALTRGEENRLATGDTKLKAKDVLIVAVAPEAQDEMDAMFWPESEEDG